MTVYTLLIEMFTLYKVYVLLLRDRCQWPYSRLFMAHYLPISNDETFLKGFLVILKRMLQNYDYLQMCRSGLSVSKSSFAFLKYFSSI